MGVDCDTGVLINNVLHNFAEEIVEGRNLLGNKTVMLEERTDDCPCVVLGDLLGILIVKVGLVLKGQLVEIFCFFFFLLFSFELYAFFNSNVPNY